MTTWQTFKIGKTYQQWRGQPDGYRINLLSDTAYTAFSSDELAANAPEWGRWTIEGGGRA